MVQKNLSVPYNLRNQILKLTGIMRFSGITIFLSKILPCCMYRSCMAHKLYLILCHLCSVVISLGLVLQASPCNFI